MGIKDGAPEEVCFRTFVNTVSHLLYALLRNTAHALCIWCENSILGSYRKAFDSRSFTDIANQFQRSKLFKKHSAQAISPFYLM
jgi:hypothetical protein